MQGLLRGHSIQAGAPCRGCARLQTRATLLQHQRPGRRCRLLLQALTSNDFRPGTTIEMDGAPYRVQEFLHVKPGKGAAFVRSKLKNCLTGNTVDKTFRAGESVTPASIEKLETQFTYADGDEYVFMDMSSYEEHRLPRDEAWAKFMTGGLLVQLVMWQGKVLSVDPPGVVELTITQSDPGVKGETASNSSKPATLETGAVIQVPLFINPGTKIKVNTADGSYQGKAN